jgi:hypothetical protein
VEGIGVLDRAPPAHLPEEFHACWQFLIERLPKLPFTSTDEAAVEQAARLYTALRKGYPTDPGYKGINDSLLALLIQLGMTPAARFKMGTGGKDTKPHKFDQLKESKSA